MSPKLFILLIVIVSFSGCHSKLGFADIDELSLIKSRLANIESNQQEFAKNLEQNTVKNSENLQNLTKEVALINHKTTKLIKQLSTDPQESSTQNSNQYLENKLLIGAVEKVRLDPDGLLFDARIDTGASTSSIDSKDILYFERDGKRWVKFAIEAKSEEPIALELPIKRMVKILQSSNEESDRRAVVELKLTIGSVSQIVEFTLTDRSHLEFPLLVGRNALKDLFVVDVSREYMLE